MSRVAAHGLNGVAVTASDVTTYDPPLQALYVGTGGTLAVVNMAGETLSFTNLPNGSWLPIQIKQVLSTGTSGATGIIGFY